MKNLTLITLLLLTLNVNAIEYSKFTFPVGVAIILSDIHRFDYAMDGKWDSNDDMLLMGYSFCIIGLLADSYEPLVISTTIDPGNAIYGSKVNKAAYDGTFRAYLDYKYCYMGFKYEIFNAIDFHSVGVFVNAQKRVGFMKVCPGIALNSIYNQNKQVIGPEVNLEVKTPSFKGFFFSVIGEYVVRPEISKFGVYSTRIGISKKF